MNLIGARFSILGLLLALWLPSLAQSAEAETPNRQAVPPPVVTNFYSVARAARAAGYPAKWKTLDEAIVDLEKGVEVKLGGAPVLFKVVPLSESDRQVIKKYLRISPKEPGLLEPI